MMNELLTIEQVASKLRLSGNTIRKMTKEGRLPAIRLGGAVRYDLKDVETLMRKKSID